MQDLQPSTRWSSVSTVKERKKGLYEQSLFVCGEGVKITVRKSTETSEPSSCDFMTDSRLTIRDPAWSWTRTSACGQQLCSLIYLWGPWQRDQDLSLVPELVVWSPLPMVDALLSLNAGWRGVVLLQLNVPCFVDYPWEKGPTLPERWMGDGLAGCRWGGSRRKRGRSNYGWYTKWIKKLKNE